MSALYDPVDAGYSSRNKETYIIEWKCAIINQLYFL